MVERKLYHVNAEETVDRGFTLEQYINRAEKRGEDVYEIQTPDGFCVYRSYFKVSPDGTKKLVKGYCIKEDELTPKEAIEAMLNREELIDYKHFPDEATYCWNGYNFISYDTYTYEKKIIKSFTGLRRYVADKEKEAEREKIRVKEILGFELDLSNLKMIQRQYGLKGAMWQAMSMCKAQKWDLTETHIYSVLANLDSDLQGMFA